MQAHKYAHRHNKSKQEMPAAHTVVQNTHCTRFLLSEKKASQTKTIKCVAIKQRAGCQTVTIYKHKKYTTMKKNGKQLNTQGNIRN